MRRCILGIGIVAVFGVLTACTSPAVSPNVNHAPANANVVSNRNVNSVAQTSTALNANTIVSPTVNANYAPAPATSTNAATAALTSPLDRPAERATKKLFGTYITPKTSPVQPERFTGYHTGVDFETFASEAHVDVPVVAACSGKVRAAQYVSGYGGVLVQQCVVAGQTVTALYGHLRLSSLSVDVGTTLAAGTRFAVLGTGFSSETDGERKHLHLSLHKGTAINWKGYVSTKGALVDWLDPLLYLPK